ncbi:MAG: sulfatase-like hydrolase/transferase [Planctomycetaceae bacterium]
MSEVVEALKKAGIRENTLIAFISDNGGPPVNGSSNGALRGFKATTWEGGVRVPFFLNWPARPECGIPPAGDFSGLDLLPTILASVGSPVSAEEKLDGVNLLPYVKIEAQVHLTSRCSGDSVSRPRFRHGDWKLVKANGIDKPALLF